MAFGQFNSPLTGTRPAGGTYVAGFWTPAAPLPIAVQGSVQPARDEELALLPEGRRKDGAYTIRSFQEIQEGDVFVLFGASHEVLRRQVWQNGVISHYLGVAVRMHPETPAPVGGPWSAEFSEEFG